MVSNDADTGSPNQQASSMAPNPGKATILALGHAFPQQLVMQDYVVDGFMKNTNCDDPELKEKLTRLCNLIINHERTRSIDFVDRFMMILLAMTMMVDGCN